MSSTRCTCLRANGVGVVAVSDPSCAANHGPGVSPEHPCPRHLTWTAIAGMLLTGAAAGWVAASLTYTNIGGNL